MSEPKKCAHTPCSCTAREGSSYCSQFCEDAKDRTSLGCDCPHTGCGGHM